MCNSEGVVAMSKQRSIFQLNFTNYLRQENREGFYSYLDLIANLSIIQEHFCYARDNCNKGCINNGAFISMIRS